LLLVSQKNNFPLLIQSLVSVLVGALLTAQYYTDDSGPVEQLKSKVDLVTTLLGVLTLLDVIILVVIYHG
tara:strand:- start:2044 stop:2253 length:210 start_codon:yes stop_codon:yes gene_type:complete